MTLIIKITVQPFFQADMFFIRVCFFFALIMRIKLLINMFKIKKLKINLGRLVLFWSPKRKRKGLIPQLPSPTVLNSKKRLKLKLWTPVTSRNQCGLILSLIPLASCIIIFHIA